MKNFNDDAIHLLAQSLSKTNYWKQCTKIINLLYIKEKQSFAEIRTNTKLSYTICRDALLLLQGACFLNCDTEGRKSVYSLSQSGYRLFDLQQILKNNKKGA